MKVATVADSAAATGQLRQIRLFAGLDAESLSILAHTVESIEVAQGEVVTSQGESADRLFLIVEGEFEVFLSEESIGFEKILKKLSAGEHFGELGLLAGGERTASVRAVTQGVLLSISRERLLEILNRSAGLATALCRSLARLALQATERERDIAYVRISRTPELERCRLMIPTRVSQVCRAVAIRCEGKRLTVGLVHPFDADTREFLRRVLRQFELDFVGVSAEDFDRCAASAPQSSPEAVPGVESSEGATLSYLDSEGVEQQFQGEAGSGRLADVLRRTLLLGASDLHLEPRRSDGPVRLRIDGNLARLDQNVDEKVLGQMVSALKVIANLDIAEHRLPQDGSFVLKSGERLIDIRVSTTPCRGGEKAVARVLDPLRQKVHLDEIILSKPIALAAAEMFLQPAGLVLVSGPTGAGKTTTLYAGVNHVWQDSQALNIVTVEDPIEYRLDIATQIQVNPAAGLSFSTILRGILRQDPDVILVGEIRDCDSAAIALEAGVSGHLVFSSLHSYSAPEAVARLAKLGGDTSLVAAGLKGILSQQLVGRICENCKTVATLDSRTVEDLVDKGVIAPEHDKVFHRGEGCGICRFTGHAGRVALVELLTIDERRKRLIEEGQLSSASFREEDSAYLPMRKYARFLLEKGIVSAEAVAGLFPRTMRGRPDESGIST